MPEWMFLSVNILSFVTRLTAFMMLMIVLREFVDALRLNGRILKRMIGVFSAISFLVIWTMLPDIAVMIQGSGFSRMREFFWYIRPFGFIPYIALTVSVYILWRGLRKQVRPNNGLPKRRWYERNK